ncbi:MAG: C4-dicarboxylate ABC transporter substrate-binding protein [Mesorhizobium sp.]|uniref:C4-dicarboxylate TRAP transporter substrate-binding protein n=1 Tax=Mesorhizobium sp. TaxID=1871066 RepID=UPI000FE569E2|nr:C4-dicarboxylate TRAP transporter substrate-binding protein [Mesorhizobium sp.]RWI57104.1 MAG: C4-dicarboxylate ABC transporter substrate-binding protein [Mesorhizobium sp.]
MIRYITTCLLAGSVALSTSSAFPEELRIAPGVPPKHPVASHAYMPFAKYLAEETGGKHTGRILGPEVANAGQMLDALQSNVVQVGLLLPLYFPASLPNMSTAGEVALIGEEPHAMAAALTEFMVTCPPCQSEMKNLGVVYLGSGSTAVYHLLTTKRVESMESISGLRLRSGGAPWSRWAEHFGAVPVSMPVNDTFEAMSQGTLDGSITSLGDLLSFRLIELVKYVNMVPIGTYQAMSTFAVTSATWDSLSPGDRTAFAKAANRANVDMTEYWAYETDALATKAAKEMGIEFLDPSAEFKAASREFAEQDIATAAQLSLERFGLEDAPDQVRRFQELVAKWTSIIDEIGTEPEAVANRIQREVWDNVDYGSYGQ